VLRFYFAGEETSEGYRQSCYRVLAWAVLGSPLGLP
jgi:hypothetical protein